ncbi:hypothetical protein M1M92_00875 [Peptococcaceae bacterium]|nr:hypothetical protein [Peptococcaceae bacterium]
MTVAEKLRKKEFELGNCFKVKFTPKKDYVIKKERHNIGTEQMNKILEILEREEERKRKFEKKGLIRLKRWERLKKEDLIEKIQDYIDTFSAEIVDVHVSETFAKALCEEFGYFKNSTCLEVKVPDFSLNRFLSLGLVFEYEPFHDDNMGEIERVRLVPFYEVDERKLIIEWVEAGCPIEWGIGEKGKEDSGDIRTKEMERIKLLSPYFDIEPPMREHKFKLTIEPVPATLWFSSLCQIYKERNQQNKWRKIKEKLFEKEGRKCWICGAENVRLEAHEFWEYDDKNLIQR